MPQLFSTFPFLEGKTLIIKKMSETDVEALEEITNNDNVYKFIPPFLYKKSCNFLLSAIRNLSGSDFDKIKLIIAGINSEGFCYA